MLLRTGILIGFLVNHNDPPPKILRAKLEPRKKIRTQGRRGPKTPILV